MGQPHNRAHRLVAGLLLLALFGARRFRAAGTAAPDGGASAFQPRPAKVGLLSQDNFPFSYEANSTETASNHAGLEGFEVGLMDALCKRGEMNCTAAPLTSLEDRIQGVANGTLDFAVAAVSFTPGREAVVHFVKPCYYASGVALFANSARSGLVLFGPGTKPGAELEAAPAGWRGVFSGGFPAGQTLCFVEGYYALPFVLQELAININISPTLEEAARRVRNGDCAALAYDSVTPTSVIGLPMLAAPPAYMSPYCVAINKQAAGGDLEQRLAWALTGVMNQGNSSEILELEKNALQSVVDAVSSFGVSGGGGAGKIPATYSLFGMRPGGRRLG